jgi:hypothetical protein
MRPSNDCRACNSGINRVNSLNSIRIKKRALTGPFLLSIILKIYVLRRDLNLPIPKYALLIIQP